jgi:RNA polymerase sigma-70 factor, ECF subfamily
MPTDTERSQRFTEQLQRCQTQVMRYIFTLVQNIDDVEDVFQQTCLALWDGFDRFDSDRSFLAWAYGVARFKAYNFLRQHRRDRLRFSEDFAERIAKAQTESTSDEIEGRRAALPGCINELSPSQQQLLMLCYGDQQRVVEVAARLGRPVCGVHNSLRLIRQRLMECIDRATQEAKR